MQVNINLYETQKDVAQNNSPMPWWRNNFLWLIAGLIVPLLSIAFKK